MYFERPVDAKVAVIGGLVFGQNVNIVVRLDEGEFGALCGGDEVMKARSKKLNNSKPSLWNTRSLGCRLQPNDLVAKVIRNCKYIPSC